MFNMRCCKNGIEHRFTKINHPWTKGQVERMNRTIKDATVRRCHYVSHDQIRRRLDDFLSAYGFGRRLKTLKGLIPYEAPCRVWQIEPHELAPPNTGTKHLALVTTAATGHQAPAQTSQGPAVSGVL